MSRYSKKQGDLEVCYGFDHASGYFFQVFGPDTEDGEENLIVDECSLFSNMSKVKMLELMEEYNIDNEEHKLMVSLDLDF